MMMKKLIALLAAAMMLLACGLASAETIGMANPWTEAATLEELNEAAGTNLKLPAVMGVTDAEYRMMQGSEYTLAEASFKVNGMPCMLRGALTADDISGVYMEDGHTAFEAQPEENPAMVSTDDMKLARWFNLDGQFVLMVNDEGKMDEETFSSIVEEMMLLTDSNPVSGVPQGTYYDRESQRAYAVVTAVSYMTYDVEVRWADSAFADNVWTMTAVMNEDGLLTYTDCVKELVVTAEDGTETRTPANLVPEGYFEVVNDTLLWTGAAEESCRACVFELYTE